MEIQRTIEGKDRIFNLFLKKQEIEDLITGVYEMLPSPHASDGARFFLYGGANQTDEHFSTETDAYYICLGDSKINSDEKLEDYLRTLNGNKIPILDTRSEKMEPLNLGYVVLNIEDL